MSLWTFPLSKFWHQSRLFSFLYLVIYFVLPSAFPSFLLQVLFYYYPLISVISAFSLLLHSSCQVSPFLLQVLFYHYSLICFSSAFFLFVLYLSVKQILPSSFGKLFLSSFTFPSFFFCDLILFARSFHFSTPVLQALFTPIITTHLFVFLPRSSDSSPTFDSFPVFIHR